jgi:uncharacterized membrane protein
MLFFALLTLLTAAAALVTRDWPLRMWIPLHLELVLFTGAAEIAGAVGLLWNRTRRLAGLLLALYFVAVFPANIHNALNGLSVEGLPQAAWYYWARLPFQPLAIWWVLFSAELIRWPFARAQLGAQA